MPNHSDPETVARLQRVLETASRQRGHEPSAELATALDGLARHSHETGHPVLVDLAKLVVDIESPTGAGLVAVAIGASVEQGADPASTIDGVLRGMLKWTALVPDEESQSGSIGIDPDLVTGLDRFGQSCVAHLQRLDDPRASIHDLDQICEELQRVEFAANGPVWILSLLTQTSGELLVLHGVQACGFRVRYRHLGNCFHLFSLLQVALGTRMPGGSKPDPGIAAKAIGRDLRPGRDQAWWHYGQPTGSTPSPASMVFGEASPASIAAVDGEQVLLLWPPILQGRNWDAGFFHPVIASRPPSVEVLGRLSAQEVARWRAELGLPPANRRSRWRLW